MPQDDAEEQTSPVVSECTPLAPHAEPQYGVSAERGLGSRSPLYGLSSEQGVIKTYDVSKLTSFHVFTVYSGTVLQNSSLWIETGLVAAVFYSIFFVMLYFRWNNFRDFIGPETNIRAFIAMFSTLIGLLLSFYTALNLGRWLQMRMGVHEITEACTRLTMLLSQGVTRDRELLSAVNRYARASLFFIFAESQGNLNGRQEAEKRGLLTHDEAVQLRELRATSFVQAQTLWVWLANLVTRLHNQKLTSGPPHYCLLLTAAEQGRGGVQHIQTYLETQIPMGYVHLLCLMVKLHNFILAGLMALVSVMHAGGRDGWDEVALFRTGFRAFFMPFLYNAMLILNAEVTDPFGAAVGVFDFSTFDRGMEVASDTFVAAADRLPGWIKADKQFEPSAV